MGTISTDVLVLGMGQGFLHARQALYPQDPSLTLSLLLGSPERGLTRQGTHRLGLPLPQRH